MFSTILTAIIAFTSTNIDDLFLLSLLFSQTGKNLSNWQIILGQYLGVGTLIVLSFLAGLGLFILPQQWIPFMGLLPILIGLKKLKELIDYKNHESQNETLKYSVASITVVTIANGADNLGVYIPLFAVNSIQSTVVTCIIFVSMIGLWLYIAKMLIQIPVLADKIKKYGKVITPIVLIAIGISILLKLN
jgi:cadmium resistance protein CadD (predicted permease)